MSRSPARFLALAVALALIGAPAAAQRAARPAHPPGGHAEPTKPAQPQLGDLNRIVAVVNGEVVSKADVVGRSRLFAANAGLGVDQETLNRLGPQVTRLLIDERLRMQEVQRRRIPVADSDVADAIGELERRNNLPNGALRQQLLQIGVQPRVLYDQLRTQIGWSRLLRVQLGQSAVPSQSEVQDALKLARARTGQPEYLVGEIFIPVDDPSGEAEVNRFVDEVVNQLRRGTPFTIAATQFSQAQSALQGGDLGWVKAEDLEPSVAAVVTRMPQGAISNAIKVPGGFTIVTLRQKREAGRDFATLVSLRQAYFPFDGQLDPTNPTPQQREQADKAQRLSTSARSCADIEAAAKATGADRPADPGPIRLETLSPPPLKALVASLAPGKASQPVLTPDGVLVMMLCAKEQKNLAELTPDDIRNQMLRDRVEAASRQVQRDLKRRAQIEMRS
jgi:peptidyl-prolyl cis-trans isomerase SurA